MLQKSSEQVSFDISSQLGIVYLLAGMLGYELSRDILVENTADQDVMGYTFPGSALLESL